MEVDANVLAEKLRTIKSNKLQVYFDYLPKEDYATIGYQVLYNAFRLLNAQKDTAE